MTYDSVRGQVVLFGGTIGTSRVPGPLWIWDGSDWSEPALPEAPARRTEHAAAFDEARGEIVIFGGSTASGTTDHTLTWNGSVLTQRTPALSPSPRVSSAMAYDAERRQIVLFGGQYGPAFSDTWIWDGTTWLLKTPVISPPARLGHAMTWDPVRKVVLLHGGFVPEQGKLVNDTWAWDGTNWTQYSPALSPSARSLHAMAYVPALERTVLYGGGSLSGDSSMADMWSWDGLNWIQMNPPQSPGFRKGAAMVYDVARQELVMFGGWNSLLDMDTAETWVYTAGPPGQTVLTLAPSSLELLRLPPGPEPSVPTIAVNAASPTAFTVSASTTDGHNWLRASPGSGVTPASIQVTLDTSMLSFGDFRGEITVSSPSAVNSTQTVPVRLTIRQGAFILSPSSASVQVVTGAVTPASHSLGVVASPEGSASFIASSNQPWLSVSPSAGVAPTQLAVSVNPGGLAPGNYSGTIALSSVNGQVATGFHNVFLNVQASPKLTVEPSAVSLAVDRAAGPQTVKLQAGTNLDSAIISAAATTTDGGAWLSITPTSALAAQNAQFTVTLNPLGMAAGLYMGSVTLSSPNVPNVQVAVPVVMTVAAPRKVLSQVADGAGWRTSITLLNMESKPAPFALRFYSQLGEPLSIPIEGRAEPLQAIESTIPGHGLFTVRTQGSSPALAQGWAELESLREIRGVGIFRRNLPGAPALEAAVNLTAPGTRSFLFFDNQSALTTSFALTNPLPFATAITAHANGSDGSWLGSSTINLAARNQIADESPDQFPATAGRKGMLLLSSGSSAFTGLGLRFDPAGPFTSFPLVSDASRLPRDQALPQIADGGGDGVWQTTVTVLNLSGSSAPFTASFFGPDGAPLSLPIEGRDTPVTRDEGVIPGMGVHTITTKGLLGPLLQGWVKVSSSLQSAELASIAVFRQRINGVTSNEAAVMGNENGRTFIMPFDNTSGSVTSLAVTNTVQSSGSAVTMTARDEVGNAIGSAVVNLAPLGQSAFRLIDLLAMTAGRRGTVEAASSTAEISCLALQFNPSGTFTSVPATVRPSGY